MRPDLRDFLLLELANHKIDPGGRQKLQMKVTNIVLDVCFLSINYSSRSLYKLFVAKYFLPGEQLVILIQVVHTVHVIGSVGQLTLFLEIKKNCLAGVQGVQAAKDRVCLA